MLQGASLKAFICGINPGPGPEFGINMTVAPGAGYVDGLLWWWRAWCPGRGVADGH